MTLPEGIIKCELQRTQTHKQAGNTNFTDNETQKITKSCTGIPSLLFSLFGDIVSSLDCKAMNDRRTRKI